MKTLRNIILIVLANCILRVFNLFCKKTVQKTLLFVKLDAIGDYVIARNFIEFIRNQERFKGHKVVLVGNSLWKDISRLADEDFVNEFIFINPSEYNDNIIKQVKLLVRLNKQNIATIISLHHFRNPLSEIISTSLPTKKRFAITGILEASSKKLNRFCNNLYTQYKPSLPNHEFNIFKGFANFITHESPSFNLPKLEIHDGNLDKSLNNYIVICHGAGVSDRIWTDSRMLDFMSFLYFKYDFKMVFVGTSDNSEFPAMFKSKFNDDIRIIDKTGKATLLETAYIIQNSISVVCYDSGIYHLSVALNKKIICIAGGGHFDRFVNYTHLNGVTLLLDETMDCFNCDWNCTKGHKHGNSYPCIESISLEDKKVQIDDFFSKL